MTGSSLGRRVAPHGARYSESCATVVESTVTKRGERITFLRDTFKDTFMPLHRKPHRSSPVDVGADLTFFVSPIGADNSIQ